MSIELFTAPTSEPVTVDEVKAHLRIDHDDEDVYLGLLITAARRYAETWLRRQLITATYKLRLDCFPCWEIEIPRPPFVSVTTLTYLNTSNISTTLTENTHFTKDIYREPGIIFPAYGLTWPSTYDVPNAVTLTYVAGYGDATDVPEEVRYGILLLVGEMYDKREPTVTGTIINNVPVINTLLGSASWGSYA